MTPRKCDDQARDFRAIISLFLAFVCRLPNSQPRSNPGLFVCVNHGLSELLTFVCGHDFQHSRFSDRHRGEPLNSDLHGCKGHHQDGRTATGRAAPISTGVGASPPRFSRSSGTCSGSSPRCDRAPSDGRSRKPFRAATGLSSRDGARCTGNASGCRQTSGRYPRPTVRVVVRHVAAKARFYVMCWWAGYRMATVRRLARDHEIAES